VLIVLSISIVWSLVSGLSVILWIGYVVVTKEEMIETLNQFAGVYSLFLTVPRKSNQVSLVGRVDPESNYFIGFHYTIHGLFGKSPRLKQQRSRGKLFKFFNLTSGFPAVVNATVLTHVLVHCSYPEKAPALLKKGLFFFYIFIFIGLIPVLLLLAVRNKDLVVFLTKTIAQG